MCLQKWCPEAADTKRKRSGPTMDPWGNPQRKGSNNEAILANINTKSPIRTVGFNPV